MTQLSGPQQRIEYLSPPADVSMADPWFEIAALDHFWVQRRFTVLRSLAEGCLAASREMGEVGCGNGLLQRQIELGFGRTVTGFDLNEYALQRNVSEKSRVCCYNIFQREAEFRTKFDLVFLFDVLEHIRDEDKFLRALRFHLAPGGKLIINVPAGMWAYSAYDVAAGHLRRYSVRSLQEVVQRNQLRMLQWTYWGLPLAPALGVRKLWLACFRGQAAVIKAGFDPGARWVNRMMAAVARCEWIPQRLLGTSLMAVLQRGGGDGDDAG